MRRKHNTHTFKEIIYDFAFKHRKKILLFSLAITLLFFVISFVCGNKTGMISIFIYPLVAITFYVDLKFPDSYSKIPRFLTSIIFFGAIIICFIFGFIL